MDTETDADLQPAGFGRSYETVFSVFLAVLAFLWRDSAHLAYPQILYLFSLLLGLNLAAGATMRLWPGRQWVSALVILANCAVITASLAYSGGPESTLWVLYLLPITTASLFLRGREVVWIAAGAVGFNALYHYSYQSAWSDAAAFLVALKSGIFVFAAASTYRLVRKDRDRASLLRARETALRGLETETREQGRRLLRAEPLAEAGMASSGVAHDLKNPLMVLLGTADMLLAKEDFPERFRPEVERMRRSARLCREIAAGVLGLAASRKAAKQRCSINRILGTALDLLGESLSKAGVEVRLDFGEALPPVEACPFELQRVFMNLLANAKDAMPKGGTVVLRTRLAGSDVSAGGPLVQAEVEDTGPGIAEEVMGKLFTPFTTSKDPGKGTGLGLYLCREIAFRHGGWLAAGNMPAGGARFVLSLPAAAREPVAEAVAEKEGA